MTGHFVARPAPTPCYAALDLGTNNCRLLIATPSLGGFKVVESFSRIVRLGDGLSKSGRLDDEAMERAIAALRICADKVRRRHVVKIRAVATQACRAAENGGLFVERIARETGLQFSVISPLEEAELAVAGCLSLLDRSLDAALVIDVGGGSTEFSWVRLNPPGEAEPRLDAWLSVPIGVVTLAERYPETADGDGWFASMVEVMSRELRAFQGAEAFRAAFEAERAHYIGTSGAITSLAGLHLNLARYDRAKVDGLWLSKDECRRAAAQLLALGPEGRANQPCIGPDRADLVLAGAAILEAAQAVWPCDRVRVADRGLREGILLSLMAEEEERGGRRRRRRRHRRRGPGAADASEDAQGIDTPPAA